MKLLKSCPLSINKEQKKLFNLKRLKSNPLIIAQIMDLANRKGWK
jgi:hypothetical protein